MREGGEEGMEKKSSLAKKWFASRGPKPSLSPATTKGRGPRFLPPLQRAEALAFCPHCRGPRKPPLLEKRGYLRQKKQNSHGSVKQRNFTKASRREKTSSHGALNFGSIF